MDTEREHDNLTRLNAFIDGELGPAERAEIAARIASDRGLARSHAVLARLKAGVSEIAEETPRHDAPVAVAPQRFSTRLALGVGAAAAIVLIAGIAGIYVGSNTWQRPAPAVDRNAIERLIVQAALPSSPVVPDLAAGGMILSGVEVRDSGTKPTLIAIYTGPRGCRLELRIRSGKSAAAGAEGTSRHDWTVRGLNYQMVAFGMPEIRFAIIAGAAERQSRLTADPAGDGRLQEARAAAPPCAA